MKTLILFSFICFLIQSSEAQSLNIKELTALSELLPEKQEQQLKKKGFTKIAPNQNNSFAYIKIQMHKDSQRLEQPIQLFQTSREGARVETIYQTTSLNDYLLLETELKSAGFKYHPISESNKLVLYQKDNQTFERADNITDSVPYYGLKMHMLKMPKSKDFLYLEDLFVFNSHEFLVTLYGKQNVKSDIFRFSATGSRKCTVIFPNTDRQAIFLWDDEVNLRGIHSIIVGELSAGVTSNTNQVTLSTWRSKQGIYCGMSLKDLEQRNASPINFYNWPAEHAGIVSNNNNKGKINLEKIKMIFSCMNCHFIHVDNSQDIISSTVALQQNQRVHISTIVIFP
jgi:hypothetical protein